MKKYCASLLCISIMLLATGRSLAGAAGNRETAGLIPPPAAHTAIPDETYVVLSDFARSGPYVQIGGVYGVENFEIHDLSRNWDNSWGYELRFGYRIGAKAAMELHWQSLLGFQGPGALRGAGASESDISSHMLSTNGRFYPFGGRFQPYVLTGLGWQNAQQKHGFEEDGFSMRFGAGLDLYLTSNVGVAMEGGYIWPVGSQLADVEEVNIIPVSASVFVRFM